MKMAVDDTTEPVKTRWAPEFERRAVAGEEDEGGAGALGARLGDFDDGLVNHVVDGAAGDLRDARHVTGALLEDVQHAQFLSRRKPIRSSPIWGVANSLTPSSGF